MFLSLLKRSLILIYQKSDLGSGIIEKVTATLTEDYSLRVNNIVSIYQITQNNIYLYDMLVEAQKDNEQLTVNISIVRSNDKIYNICNYIIPHFWDWPLFISKKTLI